MPGNQGDFISLFHLDNVVRHRCSCSLCWGEGGAGHGGGAGAGAGEGLDRVGEGHPGLLLLVAASLLAVGRVELDMAL